MPTSERGFKSIRVDAEKQKSPAAQWLTGLCMLAFGPVWTVKDLSLAERASPAGASRIGLRGVVGH